MTLGSFASTHAFGRLIYPEGVPKRLAAPEWPTDGTTEMHVCQSGFFLGAANEPGSIDLEDLPRWHTCLGFMQVEEARDWTPVWMCAAVYASEIGDAPWGEITYFASLKLIRYLENEEFVTSPEAMLEFYRLVGGGCDLEYVSELERVLGVQTVEQAIGEDED